eukprot:TRINITY_DN11830_c3_g3_i1.p1 TRINITY_DN11830_c3_g3~~TRINITY_DN11830_c3_g3_i1.p1  ORF type:complete len:1548 (+),score=282.01 TRINITY_DN11830_c3_g3_i1:76-4719(+)
MSIGPDLGIKTVESTGDGLVGGLGTPTSTGDEERAGLFHAHASIAIPPAAPPQAARGRRRSSSGSSGGSQALRDRSASMSSVPGVRSFLGRGAGSPRGLSRARGGGRGKPRLSFVNHRGSEQDILASLEREMDSSAAPTAVGPPSRAPPSAPPVAKPTHLGAPAPAATQQTGDEGDDADGVPLDPSDGGFFPRDPTWGGGHEKGVTRKFSTDDEQLRAVFEIFDNDGNGVLDVTEVHGIFLRLGLPWDAERTRELMADADVDGSGMLDFEELVEFMNTDVMQDAIAEAGGVDLGLERLGANEWIMTKRFGVPIEKGKSGHDLVQQRISRLVEESIPRMLPDGRRRRVWDCLLMACIGLVFVYRSVVVVDWMSSETVIWPYLVPNLIDCVLTTLIFGFDIWVSFDTAVKLPQGILVEREDVALHYLKHYFGLDLVAALPLDAIGLYILHAGGPSKYYYIGSILRLFKVVKVPTLFQLSEQATMDAAYVYFYFHVAPLLCFFFWVLICIHILVIIYVVVYSISEGTSPGYDQALFWVWVVITALALPGNVELEIGANALKVYVCVLFLVGLILQGVIVGRFTVLVLKSNVQETQKERMRTTLGIMQHYKVPVSLTSEVLGFQFHTLQQNVAASFAQYLDRLPTQMQQQISIYIKIDIITQVPMFKRTSVDARTAVASVLEQAYAEPDVYICTAGEIGAEMYFLMHGFADVVINTSSDKGEQIEVVVHTLKRGDFFGEVALLTDEAVRTASIKALTYCDLFVLAKGPFDELMDQHADIKEAIHAEIEKREVESKSKAQRQLAELKAKVLGTAHSAVAAAHAVAGNAVERLKAESRPNMYHPTSNKPRLQLLQEVGTMLAGDPTMSADANSQSKAGRRATWKVGTANGQTPVTEATPVSPLLTPLALPEGVMKSVFAGAQGAAANRRASDRRMSESGNSPGHRGSAGGPGRASLSRHMSHKGLNRNMSGAALKGLNRHMSGAARRASQKGVHIVQQGAYPLMGIGSGPAQNRRAHRGSLQSEDSAADQDEARLAGRINQLQQAMSDAQLELASLDGDRPCLPLTPGMMDSQDRRFSSFGRPPRRHASFADGHGGSASDGDADARRQSAGPPRRQSSAVDPFARRASGLVPGMSGAMARRGSFAGRGKRSGSIALLAKPLLGFGTASPMTETVVEMTAAGRRQSERSPGRRQSAVGEALSPTPGERRQSIAVDSTTQPSGGRRQSMHAELPASGARRQSVLPERPAPAPDPSAQLPPPALTPEGCQSTVREHSGSAAPAPAQAPAPDPAPSPDPAAAPAPAPTAAPAPAPAPSARTRSPMFTMAPAASPAADGHSPSRPVSPHGSEAPPESPSMPQRRGRKRAQTATRSTVELAASATAQSLAPTDRSRPATPSGEGPDALQTFAGTSASVGAAVEAALRDAVQDVVRESVHDLVRDTVAQAVEEDMRDTLERIGVRLDSARLQTRMEILVLAQQLTEIEQRLATDSKQHHRTLEGRLDDMLDRIRDYQRQNLRAEEGGGFHIAAGAPAQKHGLGGGGLGGGGGGARLGGFL